MADWMFFMVEKVRMGEMCMANSDLVVTISTLRAVQVGDRHYCMLFLNIF